MSVGMGSEFSSEELAQEVKEGSNINILWCCFNAESRFKLPPEFGNKKNKAIQAELYESS